MFGVYQYHQYRKTQYEESREQQLSPEVRAAVVAVIGENANLSEADVTAYLRAAKLASRTKQDTLTVGMLDRAVSLSRSAEKDKREADSCLRWANMERSFMATNARQRKGWQQYDSKDAQDVAYANQMVNDMTKEYQDEHASAVFNDQKAKSYYEASQREQNEANLLIKRLQVMTDLKTLADTN